MSRTCHALPTSCHVHMKMKNWLTAEVAAIDEMSCEGVPFRHVNRMKSYGNLIPTPWDDKVSSAWGEYHNKHHDFSANDSHWTRP